MRNLIGLISTAALTVLVALYRRYHKSVNRAVEGPLRYVYGAVKYNLGRIVNPALAAEFSLRRYSANRLASAPTRLMVPKAGLESLHIDKFYVPLTLSSGRHHEREDAALLSAKGTVVVLGEPGAGKSSMLAWLYRKSCLMGIAHPRRARLPIRLELKSLPLPRSGDDVDPATWLRETLRASVVRVNTYGAGHLFDTSVANGGVYVLLDGLDEVPTDHLERTAELITEGTRALQDMSANNVVIVASRAQAYESVRHITAPVFHDELSIEKLSAASVEKFVRSWPYAEAGYSAARTILRQLSANPRMADLVRSPLVLAMYLARLERVGVGQAALIETRTAFYHEVLGELMSRRRQHQGREGYGQMAVRDQREAFLARVAAHHLLRPAQPANSIPVATFLDRVPGAEQPGDRESWLSELMIDTGLCETERDGETLRFIHLSFCEYFAALGCARNRATWSRFIELLRTAPPATARVAQTLVMAVALTPAEARASRFDDLAAVAPPGLVLRAAGESQHFDSPAVVAAFHAELARLRDNAGRNGRRAGGEEVALALLLRDSQRVAAALGTEPAFGAVTPAALLTEFTREGTYGARKLVRQVAATDLDEAVALATDLRLGEDVTRTELGDAAPPDALLEAGLRGLRSDFRSFWCRLLAQAALHRPEVAEQLLAESASSELHDACSRIPRRLQWTRSFALRDSLYGQILTLALADGFPRLTFRPDDLLALLWLTRPRRNRAHEFAYYCSYPLVLIVLAVAATFWAATYWSGLHRFEWLALLGLVPLVVSGLVGAFLIAARRSPTFLVLNVARSAESLAPIASIRFRRSERAMVLPDDDTAGRDRSPAELLRLMNPVGRWGSIVTVIRALRGGMWVLAGWRGPRSTVLVTKFRPYAGELLGRG